MKNFKLHHKLGTFIAVLLMVFSFQSCNEENTKELDELIALNKAHLEMEEVDWDGLCNTKTVEFLAGQHIDVGQIVVGNDEENIYVKYVVEDDWYLKETHLFVGMYDDVPLSGGGTKKGKFPYKMEHDPMVQEFTYTIPIEGLPDLDCYTIAAHAEVVKMEDGEWIQEETAWGDGEDFPGANWDMYFEYCPAVCVDASFAFEDLMEGGDADYNDLVVQKAIYKSTAKELECKFFVVARGAGYDHAFKMNVEVDGVEDLADFEVTSSTGEVTKDLNGNLITLTVFPSTQDAIPGNGTNYKFAANTDPTTDPETECSLPVKEVELLLTLLDGDAEITGEAPFDPFITVYPNYPDNKLDFYDLHIDEFTETGSDVFKLNGATYPNGIYIPENWLWPQERVLITEVYPDFTGYTDKIPGKDIYWWENGPHGAYFDFYNFCSE